MGLIDSILNLACALLWLNWRSLCVVSLAKSSPMSLAGTLKKAEPSRQARWLPLASLVGVLVIRALFYWNVGSALNWTPSLELGLISLPFRSDYLTRTLLFSVLSFGLLLASVYAWLLLISVVNSRVPNDEPVQRLVRYHLGWVERWPGWVKLLLPMIVTALVWGLAHPGLVQLGIVPPPVSNGRLWQQALLLGLTSYFVWKYLLLALCILFLVNSYVYMGRSHFWTYVNTTGANLLRPLRRFPICIGKLDLSPVVGIGLVFGLSHGARLWLPRLFQHLAS